MNNTTESTPTTITRRQRRRPSRLSEDEAGPSSVNRVLSFDGDGNSIPNTSATNESRHNVVTTSSPLVIATDDIVDENETILNSDLESNSSQIISSMKCDNLKMQVMETELELRREKLAFQGKVFVLRNQQIECRRKIYKIRVKQLEKGEEEILDKLME